MPKVPTIQPGRVQAAPIRGAKITAPASAATFGGGQGLSNLTNAVKGFLDKEIDKANKIAVQEADNKAAEHQMQFLYGEDGMRSYRGKEANSARDAFEKSYKDKIIEIEKGMNSTQKEMFKQNADRRKLQAFGSIARYSAAETLRFDNQQYEEANKFSTLEASENFMDKRVVESSIDAKKQRTLEFAERNGMPPEWIENETLKHTNETHTAVISKLLETKNYKGAKDYLGANSKELVPQARQRMSEVIDKTLITGEAEENVDKIMSSDKSYSDMMSEARAIEDEDVSRETRKQLKLRINEDKTFERITQQETHRDLFNQLKGHKDITKLNQQQLNSLPVSSQKSLYAWAEAETRGVKVETDPKAYYELSLMAETPETKEKFSQVNLLDYVGKLDQGDFEKFADRQAKAKNGKFQELDGFTTRAQYFKDTIEAVDESILKDPERRSKLRLSIDREANQKAEELGVKTKDLPMKEYKKIVDMQLINTSKDVKWWPWDSKKRLFEVDESGYQVTEEEKEKMRVLDIPMEELSEIVDYLTTLGKLGTEEEIIDEYSRRYANNAIK